MKRRYQLVVVAATAFTLWQALGIVVALLGTPNMAAKVAEVDCNCAIGPFLGAWDVYVPVGGLLLGVWILTPTIVLLGATGLILWRAPRWILDRRKYYRALRKSVLLGVVVAALAIAGILVEAQVAGVVLSGNIQGGVQEAPNFRITLTNGSNVELHSFRGKLIILEFFATWCRHCQAEVTQLKQVQMVLGDGIQLLSVSTGWRGDDLEAVKRFEDAYGVTWLSGVGEGRADALYGVNSVPKIVILDVRLQVRQVFTGETSATTLLETLRPLM